jgi:dimethylargininase
MRSGVDPINVALAKQQHTAYRRALLELGLQVIYLDGDPEFPDCCFVEDPAVIVGEIAIICHMGAVSRRGEEAAVARLLQKHKQIHTIDAPGTLEGGDVLTIGKKVYVGLTSRTSREGFEQLKRIAAQQGFETIPVETQNLFHLKSDITCVGEDCVLMRPGRFEDGLFSGYRKIIVHEAEAYAANCLAVNGKVLVSEGYPRTREQIEESGFETIALDMSEFRKGDGSLTCLSKIF